MNKPLHMLVQELFEAFDYVIGDEWGEAVTQDDDAICHAFIELSKAIGWSWAVTGYTTATPDNCMSSSTNHVGDTTCW